MTGRTIIKGAHVTVPVGGFSALFPSARHVSFLPSGCPSASGPVGAADRPGLSRKGASVITGREPDQGLPAVFSFGRRWQSSAMCGAGSLAPGRLCGREDCQLRSFRPLPVLLRSNLVSSDEAIAQRTRCLQATANWPAADARADPRPGVPQPVVSRPTRSSTGSTPRLPVLPGAAALYESPAVLLQSEAGDQRPRPVTGRDPPEEGLAVLPAIGRDVHSALFAFRVRDACKRADSTSPRSSSPNGVFRLRARSAFGLLLGGQAGSDSSIGLACSAASLLEKQRDSEPWSTRSSSCRGRRALLGAAPRTDIWWPRGDGARPGFGNGAWISPMTVLIVQRYTGRPGFGGPARSRSSSAPTNTLLGRSRWLAAAGPSTGLAGAR